MATFGGVTVFSVPTASGQGAVEVMASELEGGAFGIGLTEKEDMQLRRVAVELARTEDVKALYDAMGAFLAKYQSK